MRACHDLALRKFTRAPIVLSHDVATGMSVLVTMVLIVLFSLIAFLMRAFVWLYMLTFALTNALNALYLHGAAVLLGKINRFIFYFATLNRI